VFDDLWGGYTWTDVADKTIRTLAVYLAILLLLRLAGKRSVAQLSTFDFVVILLLSNVVQNAIIGPDNSLFGGILGATLLILVNFVLVFFTFLNPRIERDLRGRETTLIVGGELQERELRRELITSSELEAALRRQGYRGVDAVQAATLEPQGVMTVTPKPQPTIEDVLAALERIERRLDRRG